MSLFFDRYPAYYVTGQIGISRDCLALRYGMLIEPNIEHITGRTILDIGSHDGRWTMAALAAGARHVTAVEIEPALNMLAGRLMNYYGISNDRYTVISANVNEKLDQLHVSRYETVFCFDFARDLVGTHKVVQTIARLKPDVAIIDACVTHCPAVPTDVPDNGSHMLMSAVEREVGVVPSRDFRALTVPILLTLLLKAGFGHVNIIDGARSEVGNEASLKTYQSGRRISMRARLR